ncbi:MAG: 7,8-didemethyl-8-hydroxy-5-deazariboflavin synthase subunit CofG [Candidatus Hermodarchaeota archaeon]
MSFEKNSSNERQVIEEIIERCIYDESISFDEVYLLLTTQDKESKSYIQKGALRKKIRIWSREITYSPNIFLPISKWCRNNCAYCAFRDLNSPPFLEKAKIEKALDLAQKREIREVLLTLGEKPEVVNTQAKTWLREHNYDSTIEYLIEICELSLQRDLIPHTNAGILSKQELKVLKPVNGSMGLMLETTADLSNPNQAHEFSPYKQPSIRLKMLKNAGKLKIPFTTGLLIGIGEKHRDIIESLQAIKQLYHQYQHIQEVIIQNFVPHPQTPFQNRLPPSFEFYLQIIAIARLVLPGTIALQVPPNLNRGKEASLLAYGINDWGGISSITPDYVNPEPETSWPEIEELIRITQKEGFTLKKRWCVYPHYQSTSWIDEHVLTILKRQEN